MHYDRLSKVLVVAGLSLVGCGGQRASTPAQSPEPSESPGKGYAEPSSLAPEASAAPAEPAAPPASTADEESFATLEQAEAALARARQQLDSLLVTENETASSGQSAPPKSPAPRASGAPRPREERKAANDSASEQADSRCANACRAFASLERAADAVCRLAGASNDRCTQARRLVTTNQDRIKSCGCTRNNR